MNNIELYTRFTSIATKNCFDQFEELKKLKKQYKASDFYKATKMPLRKAYQMYLQSLGLSVAGKLNTIMDKDYIVEYMNVLFEEGKLQESLEQVVNKVLSNYNPEELAELREQTRTIMEKLNII